MEQHAYLAIYAVVARDHMETIAKILCVDGAASTEVDVWLQTSVLVQMVTMGNVARKHSVNQVVKTGEYVFPLSFVCVKMDTMGPGVKKRNVK
uniref:Uncharacterized protein n=1 Tax=Arion vulgaris TaxID=1028688 RepID=A0A0B6YF91_9EUPU